MKECAVDPSVHASLHPSIHLIDNAEQCRTVCCHENKRLCFPGNCSSKAPASLLSALSPDEIQWCKGSSSRVNSYNSQRARRHPSCDRLTSAEAWLTSPAQLSKCKIGRNERILSRSSDQTGWVFRKVKLIRIRRLLEAKHPLCPNMVLLARLPSVKHW